MEKHKEKLIKRLKLHIEFVREKISEKLKTTKVLANRSLKELNRMPPEDQMVYMDLKAKAENRVLELTHLDGSPYFTKCQIVNEKGEEKEYYFSKHELYEQSIYSWVAPIAAIRFENPGQVSYKLPDGTIKKIIIKQKEQYMIVDGKVIFFAVEARGLPRDLIYQEHFTQQKSTFALPEIVAQMEKAQDQVIRASHKGPLVISGPAGSGKTTLALHRVAYLTQAPDTALLYPPRSIIVFVQDTGTKEYFSTLLPGLGITNVHIVTFSEWALSILSLNEYIYVERFGENEEEKDLYEYQKLRALREVDTPAWNSNIPIVLSRAYKAHFSSQNSKLLDKQKEEKILDRFDLVILLQSYYKKHKKFETRREYQTFVKDEIVRKVEKTRVEYSLTIIDEFQNYLPEQLHLFKNCLNEDTLSTVYVGDIAQQVKLGTIRNLEDLGEIIPKERDIRLDKVYRNTKSILTFIQSLGYSISVPDGIKDGPSVVERLVETEEDEVAHIKENISKYEKGIIGIIAKEESYLYYFKEEFKNIKNIHVLSMLESQGVEFDIVFIVGVKQESFKVAYSIDILPEHIKERERMQKDLLYVALTRAITELHVLGKDKLKDVFN